MLDEENFNSVDSIINQLKKVPVEIEKTRAKEHVLTKDNLEEFILKHTGKLVSQASESVELVKDYVETAPNSEDITALAELIRATSSAVEGLNKILISDKKNQTAINIKQMELRSRQEQFDTAVGVKLMLTREELMKQLLSAQSTIEVEDVTPKSLE